MAALHYLGHWKVQSQSHNIWFLQAIERLKTAQNSGGEKLIELYAKYSQDAFKNMPKQTVMYVYRKDFIFLVDSGINLKELL